MCETTSRIRRVYFHASLTARVCLARKSTALHSACKGYKG